MNYKNNSIALLTIRTFNNSRLEQSGERFSDFLDTAFREIQNKKIKTLIIDIRGNQGGNDENGSLLYSYISKTPFKYYASLEQTKRKLNENEHSNLKLQYPKENAFGDKIYFLIDGRSFSVTAEFAAIARSNNRGLFFGEETGGGYYGNTSGTEENVSLPNSKISCRIPMTKYAMAVKKAKYADRGVIPDLPYYITINDITENKDRQLEYLLNYIKRN